MLRRLRDIDIALLLTHCLSSYTLGRVTRYLALLDRSVGGVCVGFGPHRHCLHIIFGAHRGGLSFKIPSPTSSQSSLSSLNFPRNTAARNLRQEFRTAFAEAEVDLADFEIFTEADIVPVTESQHYNLTPRTSPLSSVTSTSSATESTLTLQSTPSPTEESTMSVPTIPMPARGDRSAPRLIRIS